ncbi:MAG: hypothetical protein GX589_05115 [Deltaproteobacteria bacterium]|nr:hypothetical protein [Deltaproteobacteria bacterium]
MTSFRATLSADWKLLVLLVLLALMLRLDFLTASNFRIDADEGIVGLMAMHILEGRPIPAFYYGQDYMGSFEALVAVPVFQGLGVSSAALKSVPLFFSLVFVLLVYLLGFEVGGRKVARLSGLFAAVCPAALVVWSSKARGGFIEVVVIGTLAMLLCVRSLRAQRLSCKSTLMIALLLGFGWWVNNQIIYYMLAIGFGMLCHLWWGPGRRIARLVKHLACGLVGFFLGGLPFWVYNLQHEFSSFRLFGASGKREILAHLTELFTTALPIILGARRDWGTEDVFPFASLLTGLIYSLLFLYLLFLRRAQIRNLFCLRLDRGPALEILILFLFGVGAVFSISSFGSLAKSPRYILPAYSAIFVLTAFTLCRLGEVRRILSAAVVAMILVINLASCYWGGRGLPGEPFVFEGERVVSDHAPLITWLRQHGYSFVRTNYWIGYRLAFETEEEIKFVVFGEPAQVRIKAYEEQGAAVGVDQMPLVLVPAQTVLVEAALQACGYRFKRERVSGYDVIFDLEPSQKNLRLIPHSQLMGQANYKPEDQTQALDGRPDTRWGSGHPQSKDMQFVVSLKEPRRLRALRYELGDWRHDYPRGFEIELELPGGERRLLLSEEQYQSMLYYGRAGAEMMLLFEPVSVERIILKQRGEHPILDWSIAEIELFE